LSTTAALVLPLTFRRARFPSLVYPSVISPCHSPEQLSELLERIAGGG